MIRSAPPQAAQVSMSMPKTRLRRCDQAMATGRCAGVFYCSSLKALGSARLLVAAVSLAGNGAAPLVCRWHAGGTPVARCPADARASTPERARLQRPDARQPRTWALTAHPTPANFLPRAHLDAQGGLDFLSVGWFSLGCWQVFSAVLVGWGGGEAPPLRPGEALLSLEQRRLAADRDPRRLADGRGGMASPSVFGCSEPPEDGCPKGDPPFDGLPSAVRDSACISVSNWIHFGS
jgi:hypothetical protein